MQPTRGLTAATLAALVAATLATALPAAARGPGEGMGMSGMMGDGLFMDEMFQQLDADGDGKISAEEIKAHRSAEITGVDANKDGKLSQDELVALEMKRMEQMATNRAMRQIERLDADGDGLLSIEEMAARPMPMRMFERVDADGDGAISREEIEAAKLRMAEHRDGREGRRGHGNPFWGDTEN